MVQYGIKKVTRAVLATELLLVLLVCANAVSAAELDPPKLITNVSNVLELLDEVEQTPLEQSVYDLSFAAYDNDFAGNFGLDAAHVTELDTGLRFIELRMVTEGKDTNCYYNMVLDKSVKLSFPAEDYTRPTEAPFPPQTVRRYTQKLPKETGPRREALVSKHKELFKIIYDHNSGSGADSFKGIFIGNRGYKFHKTGKPYTDGGVAWMSATSYAYDRSLSHVLISLKTVCDVSEMLEYPELAIWIRKEGRQQSSPNLEDYHTFLLPKRLIDDFRPTLSVYADRRKQLKAERVEKIKERIKGDFPLQPNHEEGE
jgi:hypothetical protein